MQIDDLPEGWIEHFGGRMPVPGFTRPGVLFRDGDIYEPDVDPTPEARVWSEPEGDNWWEWEGDEDSNIIAYIPGQLPPDWVPVESAAVPETERY